MARKPFTPKKRSGGNGNTMTFTGYVSYAKVYDPDEFRGVTKWKLNLHPDDDEIKRIKAAGIQLKLHDSNEGVSGVPGKYFTFSRPTEKEFDDGITYFAPPSIYGPDGEPIMTYQDNGEEIVANGNRVLIGNGSLIQIGVTVYDTKRFGKGTRLNWVKILELVEYDPEAKTVNEEEEEDETPVERPTSVTKRKVAARAASAPKKNELPW